MLSQSIDQKCIPISALLAKLTNKENQDVSNDSNVTNSCHDVNNDTAGMSQSANFQSNNLKNNANIKENKLRASGISNSGPEAIQNHVFDRPEEKLINRKRNNTSNSTESIRILYFIF